MLIVVLGLGIIECKIGALQFDKFAIGAAARQRQSDRPTAGDRPPLRVFFVDQRFQQPKRSRRRAQMIGIVEQDPGVGASAQP